MNIFLSDTYDKPKLVENKMIKKILIDQKSEITIQTKIKTNLFEFAKNNYKIIIFVLLIIIILYWRYNETKKKKIIKSNSEDNFENSD